MDFSSSLNFTDAYVENLLESQGITLTDQQKQFYLPQLATMAEKHVGAALMARLNESQVAEFQNLFEKDTTTGEEWNHFWKTSIPDFESAVETSLQSFGTKVRDILAKTA